jgi:hypothetical protein
MNQRGIFISFLLLANLSATSNAFAQLTSEQPKKQSELGTKLRETIMKDRPHTGYFGLSVGSKTNTYQSAPTNYTPRAFDLGKTQSGLTNFSRAVDRIRLDQMIKFQPIQIPAFNLHHPNLELGDFETIIDKKAVQTFLNQHLTQFQPIAQAWEGHVHALGNIINDGNFNSIVNFEALTQNITAYIDQHDLLFQAQNDFSLLQNLNWNNISLSDFINENALQETLDQLNHTFQMNQISAQDFLTQSENQLNNSFQGSLTQTIAAIRRTGFSFHDGKLMFQDPSNSANRFSFLPGDSSARGECSILPNGNMSGWFSLNAGDCILINGSASFNTQQTLTNLSNHGEGAIQGIISTLQSGLENQTSLDDLLSQLQSQTSQISQSALPTILQEIRNNLSSDFSITLNLQSISNGFTGSGDYQYIDIILETLGHDVGSITLNKQQIIDIVMMMTQDGNEALVGQYILEKVAGYETDIVGYNIARDVANTYLSDHVRNSTTALLNNGLIQIGTAFYGSFPVRKGEKATWSVTGNYNLRSINNSPVLKENGLLHLRTELVSHSLGIAYLPKLWKNDLTRTSVNGIIHVQGLFVRAGSASVLTKTNLMEENAQDIVELYRVPLNEIPEAQKTYALPMLSAGINLQQGLTRALTVNGYLITYPGLAEKGSLDQIAKAIVPRYQIGASFSIRIEDTKKRQLPPAAYIVR